MTSIPSLSLNPRYDAPSAWWQHVPVAHWLVDVIKPDTIVELGTHYGVSFFAFCEASEAFSSNSFVFAVDTWEGDEHSGAYSEEVYNKVLAHWSGFHRSRSRLVRSTFDEAANYFENKSIDILHIDGLHTYEAVQHDFKTWLPKLKDESVVLLHDINVRERGFGVWKFWLELKANPEYLSIEVKNGHGLGLLIKGSRCTSLLNDYVDILPLLAAKGELVEKLAESKTVAEQARVEAEQARVEAEQARVEAELILLQLHHNQEELEDCLIGSRRNAAKLAWHRSQREYLMRMLSLQSCNLRALMAINGRATSKY
jgi:hypothetical protein